MVSGRRSSRIHGACVIRHPPDQHLEKDPDRRVQQAIGLVFGKFLELGSVRQTLLWFLEHGLEMPVRNPLGEIGWKRPSYATVYRILTGPVYAGAYAYGKTEHTLHTMKNGEARKGYYERGSVKYKKRMAFRGADSSGN